MYKYRVGIFNNIQSDKIPLFIKLKISTMYKVTPFAPYVVKQFNYVQNEVYSIVKSLNINSGNFNTFC